MERTEGRLVILIRDLLFMALFIYLLYYEDSGFSFCVIDHQS